MSRTYLTFGDITGKLHMLRIECTRCTRKGQYNVAKLIARHGQRGNMSKWVSDLRGDCPKRNAPHLHERCDLICPICRRCCERGKCMRKPRQSCAASSRVSDSLKFAGD
jgi:hypothetical protein